MIKLWRNFTCLILLLMHLSCDFIGGLGSGGVLGGKGKVFKFDCTRGELETCINNDLWSIKNIPEHLKKYYHDWDKPKTSPGFLIGKVFYLKANKEQTEEMYYVTLVSEKIEDTTWTKPSYLGIRALNIIDGNNQWKTDDDISTSEWERIDARFEKDIINQIQNSSCGCKHIGYRE
jgi:hypothetical protein